MNALYRFQAISEDDLPLLANIYATSRQDFALLSNWPEGQRGLFLQQQFDSQHQHYIKTYPLASYDLIYLSEQVVGRLYVDRNSDRIHIIDISLLPQFRQQGLGTAVISQLLSEVEERPSGRTLSLCVEKTNPAMNLYHKLGFTAVYDRGIYVDMQRQFS